MLRVGNDRLETGTFRAKVELAVVGNRWETGRTAAFSDGVFAIAITLLVLDIRVPASEFDNLWSGILHEWPAYLGYATSFLTVGGLGSPTTGSSGACATRTTLSCGSTCSC
jgi:Endosomal/lysosomal potassium channel TMEM175